MRPVSVLQAKEGGTYALLVFSGCWFRCLTSGNLATSGWGRTARKRNSVQQWRSVAIVAEISCAKSTPL